MQPLRLVVFLTFVAGLGAYELSPDLVEFYCVMNGYFTDAQQVKTSNENRTLTTVRIQPVLAPQFSKIPCLYFEQFNAGKLSRALVLKVIRQDDGTIITIPFNFSGNMDIQQGSFDANKIKSFTWDNLQGTPDCKDSYTRIGPYEIVANWVDCTEAPVNGKRGSYSITMNCDVAFAVMPVAAAERPTLIPYRYTREGDMYPMENAPDNYVCNCNNTSS